jgi:hypothetical protein
MTLRAKAGITGTREMITMIAERMTMTNEILVKFSNQLSRIDQDLVKIWRDLNRVHCDLTMIRRLQVITHGSQAGSARLKKTLAEV